jgi:hypothetical protein
MHLESPKPGGEDFVGHSANVRPRDEGRRAVRGGKTGGPVITVGDMRAPQEGQERTSSAYVRRSRSGPGNVGRGRVESAVLETAPVLTAAAACRGSRGTPRGRARDAKARCRTAASLPDVSASPAALAARRRSSPRAPARTAPATSPALFSLTSPSWVWRSPPSAWRSPPTFCSCPEPGAVWGLEPSAKRAKLESEARGRRRTGRSNGGRGARGATVASPDQRLVRGGPESSTERAIASIASSRSR